MLTSLSLSTSSLLHRPPPSVIKLSLSRLPIRVVIAPNPMHLKRCGAQLALERESDGRLEREMGAGGVPQHKREVGVESVLEREEGEESEMGVERENVEILESLEEEAIMGEDKGRTPSDYNRRAHLFDRSSNAFRALKQRHGK